MPAKLPIVLLILDGWGYQPNSEHNAIAAARTPNWDQWWASMPHLLLEASGHKVGLPDQQMGNSEVGHMHIGAGRRIPQDFTRINDAIESGEFLANPLFNYWIKTLKESGKSLHVMGLLSPGGVHSHENHLFALIKLCHQLDFRQLVIHAFLDGRDTPPQSALSSLKRLQAQLTDCPVGEIHSLTGRYYAMDRDKRWERVEPVYQMLTEGQSEYQFHDVEAAIKHFYDEQITDEFIPPTLITDARPIVDGDAVMFFNFRADRARQLTAAFLDEHFSGFHRNQRPKLAAFISMTAYSRDLPSLPAFAPVDLSNTLGEVISQYGYSQLRIAETEKYAHVTFFFNGGNEQVFDDEDRILVPSPKVSTYDLQPEMSAPELTMALIDAIQSRSYDVIICNYANADMVGHTGNFAATVKAIEVLDYCLGQVAEAVAAEGGLMLITSDHGNAEAMFDSQTGQAHTAHTTEPVPFLFIGEGWHTCRDKGSLIDIAPTILTLMNIRPPEQMTGVSLLEADHG